MREKIEVFLKTKWGALGVWVLVLYLVSFVWSAMDSRAWWALPTYLLTGGLWLVSTVWAAHFHVEWKGDRFALRGDGAARREGPSAEDP